MNESRKPYDRLDADNFHPLRQAIEANRRCPLHQDPAQANPINNRPEDFLATRQQKEFYDHVLQRSVVCHWHDLPQLPEAGPPGDRSGLTRDGFHRETTPKDMRDIKMLDSIMEEDMRNPLEMAGDSGSNWRDRSLQMEFAMSEHPPGSGVEANRP
jgi:hypothetical protein